MLWRNSRLTILLVAMTGLLAGAAPGAERASPVIGWVEIKPVPGHGDQISVVGHALALEAVEGKFALSLKKEGQGGTSNTGQSGSFKIAPGDQATLSRTSINLAASDK